MTFLLLPNNPNESITCWIFGAPLENRCSSYIFHAKFDMLGWLMSFEFRLDFFFKFSRVNIVDLERKLFWTCSAQIDYMQWRNAIFPYLHIKWNANLWLFSHKGTQMNGLPLTAHTFLLIIPSGLGFECWICIRNCLQFDSIWITS